MSHIDLDILYSPKWFGLTLLHLKELREYLEQIFLLNV